MSRAGWLGVLSLVALGAGAAARLRWPSAEPALRCDPGEVRLLDNGVAACAPGASGRLPAGAALALGGKLDLNGATTEELALVPGVGRALARALVEARAARGGFRSWGEVDAVRGVGPAKLELLRRHAELHP